MHTTSSNPLLVHLERTSENAHPAMQSGRHESVGEFLAVQHLRADLDAPLETFEPAAENPWLCAGLAAAVAHGADPFAPATDFPFLLAVYVEGDVTTYRFRTFADAAHAGWLWSVAG